jgi:hypothetical protein
MPKPSDSGSMWPKIFVGVLLLVIAIAAASKLVKFGDADADAASTAPAAAPAPAGPDAADTPAAADAPVAAAPPAPAPVAPPASSLPRDTSAMRSRTANLTGTDTAPLAIVVSTGESFPYAELDKHIGERVQITTKLGTVRHGRVLSTNSIETHLQLDAKEGGFSLVVPAETVNDIRLILDAPGA